MRRLLATSTLILLVTLMMLAVTSCSDEPAAENDATASSAGAAKTDTVGNEEVIASAVAEPEPVQTTTQEIPVPSGTTAPQSVGELIDGLRLEDVRWGDHGTHIRVVFDLATTSGAIVEQQPHADAVMSGAGTEVEVTLGGIRGISDNPNAVAQQITVGDTLVTSIDRVPSMDDQAMIYSINLAEPSTYSLSSLSSPGRVIVDIYR